MPPDLPHVAITLASDEIPPAVLIGLGKLTGQGLGSLRDAIKGRRPVVEQALFSNAYHDDGIACLRSIVALLQGSDVGFDVYEIGEGERYDTVDLETCRITPEILENILTQSEQEHQ